MTDSFENNKEVLKISIPLKNSRIDKKCKEYNKYAVGFFYRLIQGFEIRRISVELVFYVKTVTVLFFCNFNDFFCKRHSLMNGLCHNNLFQIMQHDNFK